jgi:hypothetical protein
MKAEIMNKLPGIFYIILAAISFFAALPFIVYSINFWEYGLSKNTEIWSHFGTYLDGTLAPLIALVGIAVTLLLRIVSEEREQLKQRPLLHIGYWDFQNKIEIFMQNKGIGPLLIKKYEILDAKSLSFPRLFDCLPPLQGFYGNYTGNKADVVLSPGENDQLLLYESHDENSDDMEKLREPLKDLKIKVEDNDIYGNEMLPYERSLEWFGRNVPPKKTPSPPNL